MFDMQKNTGDNKGYQLRITYKVEMNQYYVTGYIRFECKRGESEYERDGETHIFDTMEDAIGSIINFEEKK